MGWPLFRPPSVSSLPQASRGHNLVSHRPQRTPPVSHAAPRSHRQRQTPRCSPIVAAPGPQRALRIVPCPPAVSAQRRTRERIPTSILPHLAYTYTSTSTSRSPCTLRIQVAQRPPPAPPLLQLRSSDERPRSSARPPLHCPVLHRPPLPALCPSGPPAFKETNLCHRPATTTLQFALFLSPVPHERLPHSPRPAAAAVQVEVLIATSLFRDVK